ncbi:ABC transporter substrate-binding protein [Ileibacterium valens]|uniref:Branched-chain amino acid ABC transporter substrate-binding protein n=1 Tax=Ileibacterium valens TaxID=1862668 RepID=A0A1U7ND24_9FIRM|nr:ABC transporter substrate-binding protein [Ileibacterium valens]OLU36728.1 branched-chain amino acid ABC transporter substrate-binding protein [Ileibacterium valens]OLU39014.1 branched-chain amino acid ABC transporter substrate-binding protein [Erysipelotrichaceae bacterium NYU-BL-F16]OLU41221.1 branched-chain amino acid ABC transporter substrate-binding protein [Erysipelotrichaceae bacterium NYU-BL-E8]
MNFDVTKKSAAVFLSAAMLAGCSSAPADSSSDAADSNAGSETNTEQASGNKVSDTVKIGLNFELTGELSDYGIKELNGAKIAIKHFNEREDKPFTVEGVEIDDKGDTQESITAITRLVEQDGVVGVVGPATSGASIATYDFASQKATPVISPSATQVNAMMKADGTPYEYAWRVCFEDSVQGAGMAVYDYETLGAKKVVIFNANSDYGRGLADAFKTKFTELGGEIVDTVEFGAGDKDFSSYVTRIKSLDYDCIYIAGYYNESAQIVNQLKADGVSVPITGADGFDSADFRNQIGKDNANDIFYTTAYTSADPSDELKKFIDDYQAEYGEEPGMFAALSYDATNLLLSSLEATGEDGAALNKEIENANFSGITGSFTFDKDTHTPNKSILIVELVDGEQANTTEQKVD